MLIPTFFQVATTFVGPALSVSQSALSAQTNSILLPRLPDPNANAEPDPIPEPYTTWEPNGQLSVVNYAPTPVPAPPPPVAAPPAAPPTTAWAQQPSPAPAPPPAPPPGPAPNTPTWTPGVAPAVPAPSPPPHGGPPAAAPPVVAPPAAAGGPPPGGVVVGGSATIVLSPDKTIVVENPAITLPPYGEGGPPPGAAAAWTSAPPGWYATTYYACQGQGGCQWHIQIRPVAGSASSLTVYGGGLRGRIWSGLGYGMMVVAVVLVVR